MRPRTGPTVDHTESPLLFSSCGREYLYLGKERSWLTRSLILGTGIALLPESPRWYVKRGRLDDASRALARIRGQPADSSYIQEELAEIVANHEYEMELSPQGGYFASWAACFTGGLRNPASNLRRTILGTSIQVSSYMDIVLRD